MTSTFSPTARAFRDVVFPRNEDDLPARAEELVQLGFGYVSMKDLVTRGTADIVAGRSPVSLYRTEVRQFSRLAGEAYLELTEPLHDVTVLLETTSVEMARDTGLIGFLIDQFDARISQTCDAVDFLESLPSSLVNAAGAVSLVRDFYASSGDAEWTP